MMKAVKIRITDYVIERLHALAEVEGRTFSDICRRALTIHTSQLDPSAPPHAPRPRVVKKKRASKSKK